MRKIFLFTSFVIISVCVFGQALYVPNGNVGITTNPNTGNIGIGTINPSRKLTVKAGSENSAAFRVNSFGSDNRGFQIGFSGETAEYISFEKIYSGVSETFMSVARVNGNIGIGTNSPSAKLETFLDESGKALALLGTNKDVELHIGHATGTSHGFYWKYVGTRSGNLNDLELWSQNMSGEDKLIYQVHQDGNLKFGQKIGIGCNAGINGYELAVNGTIGAKEVIVTNDNWADFVFETDYNLMSLKELNNYILENKHLPEIPTTQEVKENGISVGEMNAKLLQKIEELTLYIIELNEKNNQQDKIITRLHKQIQQQNNLKQTN